MSRTNDAEGIFVGCRGAECPAFSSYDDDPHSMWPSVATAEDVKADCESMGFRLNELAPARLHAADDCPSRVLRDIAPGATKNPISLLKNIHLRKQLGLEYVDSTKIIY